MAAKPHEVIAKCTMVGLPAAADIEAIGQRLEKARRQAQGVVRAVPQPPAVYRDGRYVVDARVVVLADDGEAALRAAGRLFEAAKVICSELYLSGRALSEADTPRPTALRRVPAVRAQKRPGPKRKAAAKTRAAKGKRRS